MQDKMTLREFVKQGDEAQLKYFKRYPDQSIVAVFDISACWIAED